MMTKATDNYCTIYVVRHGESESNVEKVVAGNTDKQLTKAGERQARERGEHLAKIKFDAVFSSDLMRAKRTAELIAMERELAVMTTELLRERNFGEWENRPEEEYLKTNKHLLEKLKILSEKEKRDLKFGQGYESNTEIAERLATYLREIAVTYLGKTVLVVSHGSIMRALLMELGFANYEELPPKSIENTGYFILESDGVDFFIKKTFGVNKINNEPNPG